MVDTPIAVFSVAWDIVEFNALWNELFRIRDQAPGPGRNLVWRHFVSGTGDASGSPIRGTVVRDAAEAEAFERELVSDLRRAADRYPDDRAVAELVAALREANPRFAELWSRHEQVSRSPTIKNTLDHELGPITFDCSVLSVDGSDLRIVIYTAQPGTRDGETLDALRQRRRGRHD